jgi:hypothetical protein
MIEQGLLDEICDFPSSHEISEIHADDASLVLELIQDTFIEPLAGQWWWEPLRGESVVIHYGDNDGLSVVLDLIGKSESVFLIPTDDESPPWPVFVGNIDKIIDLLRNLRFFEYFLMDKNGIWAVFDTHDNSLVVIGALVDRARKIQALVS